MAQFYNFKGDYYGLTDEDIKQNTEMYGFNIYKKNEPEKQRFRVSAVLLSPSFILMLLAGILSFFGGGIGSGIVILLILAAYVYAEIYFGKKSDTRLDDIKETTSVKFRAIRNGKLELISKEQILPDEVIVIQAGERVPADAFIMESRDVTVDESIFTGSNKPVSKFSGAISKSELSPNFLYSGTVVLSGIAICTVSATGVDTKLFIKSAERPETHGYYTELEKTVRSIIPLCSAVAAVMAFISLVIWIITSGEVVTSALRGITLGLCFLPTGVSTIIRMYYTKGAADLVSAGAVVKSLRDIEKLNSLSVLCVEKEGAISKDHVEVKDVYTRSEELFYKVAALAFEQNTIVPNERALMVKAAFFDENIADVYNENKFIEKIPESTEAMGGALWEIGGSKLYCIRGIPEQILPLCRLNGNELFAAQKKCGEYYAAGCTVMAIACADAHQGDLDSTAGFSYTFIGFAAFSSPLRDSVSAAVKTCRRAGVRVVMLTEDNPSVAESTGKMIGLSDSKAVTGKMISESVKYGTELPLDADIYAKTTPEQKLYVIDRLKKNGEVVAMTGTRVTDADALELADVGITFLQHTAGSTYESADIIMSDDNFSAIADMIAAARQIHRNIKRSVSVIISVYASMLLLNILNIFGNAKLMLNPPLLALITMIIAPLLAVGYISCKSDMRSNMPPSEFVANRKLNYSFVGEAALIGILSGIAAVASYMFMYNGSNISFARSCALISLCACTAGFALIRPSTGKNLRAILHSGKTLLVCVGIVLLLPVLLVYIPLVNSAFGLVPIDLLALFICVITGVLPVILYYTIRHFVKFK